MPKQMPRRQKRLPRPKAEATDPVVDQAAVEDELEGQEEVAAQAQADAIANQVLETQDSN